ncbi:hypothetical protein Taro_026603, partial [Colocasia esculenta]|nr:hypothetical protein [Colocasia esculenta]
MGMTIEQAKKLDHFLCSDCDSEDVSKRSQNTSPVSPLSEPKRQHPLWDAVGGCMVLDMRRLRASGYPPPTSSLVAAVAYPPPTPGCTLGVECGQRQRRWAQMHLGYKEVLRRDGHGFTVDWWALGVLAYGRTPFRT